MIPISTAALGSIAEANEREALLVGAGRFDPLPNGGLDADLGPATRRGLGHEGLLKVVRAGGIGDVTSDARGSGARYNNGKPDLSLIPLRMLAATFADAANPRAEVGALFCLGDFQSTHDPVHLERMLAVLGIAEGWQECAHVFEYGKAKYAAWNWAKGMPWSVPVACAARHLLAMIRREELDDESGLPHRGHVFCNVTMLLHYVDKYTEGNDLPPKGML